MAFSYMSCGRVSLVFDTFAQRISSAGTSVALINKSSDLKIPTKEIPQ